MSSYPVPISPQWAGVALKGDPRPHRPGSAARYAIFSYGEGGAHYNARAHAPRHERPRERDERQPLSEIRCAPRGLNNEPYSRSRSSTWVRKIGGLADDGARFPGEGGYPGDNEYFGCEAEI